jgi:hypothetical protein
MQPLVECVPNFSDGRNPEVYSGDCRCDPQLYAAPAS